MDISGLSVGETSCLVLFFLTSLTQPSSILMIFGSYVDDKRPRGGNKVNLTFIMDDHRITS